jgi:hypothetical protein
VATQDNSYFPVIVSFSENQEEVATLANNIEEVLQIREITESRIFYHREKDKKPLFLINYTSFFQGCEEERDNLWDLLTANEIKEFSSKEEEYAATS